MELQTVDIRYKSKSDVFKLTPLGDEHIGNAGCDEDELRRWVKEIAADPKHYTLLMGDTADYIQTDDRRWDERK